MRSKALSTIQQAIMEEPEMIIQGWAHMTTAVYAMCEAIV
jgi:hypothetical protein